MVKQSQKAEDVTSKGESDTFTSVLKSFRQNQCCSSKVRHGSCRGV